MKLYFKKEDERCYPLSYFKQLMEEEDLEELTLYEAQRQYVEGVFWCTKYGEAGDKDEEICGKECDSYSPKNGISGCCRHYSLKFYEPSDKCINIILNRKDIHNEHN